MTNFVARGGWRPPPDRKAQEKYPLGAALHRVPERGSVEMMFPLPGGAEFREFYNQGERNACAGYSCSQLMSILNSKKPRKFVRYDPVWLWNAAKEADPWAETNPGDNEGTSIRTALELLRTVGHCRLAKSGAAKQPSTAEGIEEYRWAVDVDGIRTAIANVMPVVLGTEWYSGMTDCEQVGGEWWMHPSPGRSGEMGHAYLVTGWSDKRSAGFVPNTWGAGWPAPGAAGAWLPEGLLLHLLHPARGGEAGVVTDKLRGGGGRA